MPRRAVDPAAAVIRYFQTAPIETAQTVLAIADEALRGRLTQTATKPAGKQKKVPLPGPGPATVGE